MARTQPAPKVPTFTELLEFHTLERPASLDDEIKGTLDGIAHVTSRSALHVNDENYWSAVSSLVQRYFCFQLAKRYKPLSSDIFQLKRNVIAEVPRHADGRHQETFAIPLFAVVHPMTKTWSHEHAWEGADTYGRKANNTLHVEATVPRMPQAIVDKALEALAYVSEVKAGARREKALGELLTFSGKAFPQPTEDLRTIWIPRDEDLKVWVEVKRQPERDPALLLKYEDNHFIVGTWNIESERAMEHYLREYAGVLDSKPFKRNLKLTP
ncbi:hypothetical protein HY493_00855 [Candidatus Woesearchaeota archaeon]|nr:hypothetical protein [Candidatus Woesearchaeota archaeon]